MVMEREKAVILAYQIATLSSPSAEVLDMLLPLRYERTLELLLVLRQSPREVKSPANFLRRAIAEGWTPETLPEAINRREQNIEARHYMKRGASRSEAEAKALENQKGGTVWGRLDRA